MKTKVKIERDGKIFYTIRSQYVFNSIMMDKDVCLEFLRLVFPELQIRDIEINAEQAMENHLGKRGIRLDIYIEVKGVQRVIDMEMQVSDDSAELPKRTRYYSSTIDGWLLNKSEDYENLCDTIILFVCPFDPFKRGQKIYTFEHKCLEEPDLTLQNGQRIRFLNTVGVKGSISKELQAVFDYITSDDGEAEERFAKKLKEMVSEINADAERIGVVMTFEEELQHELRHNDSIWKRRLEEKEALLEEKTALLEQNKALLEQNAISLEQKTVMLAQNAISLEQKDSQLSEQTELIKKQDGIIADLKRQIEALKKG